MFARKVEKEKDGQLKKGKGKGKGKVAEFISEAPMQPESETSPAKAAAQDPPLNAPLTPFVASSAMPSSCFRTMLDFEQDTIHSCEQSNIRSEDWGLENSMKDASEQTRMCLNPENLVPLRLESFSHVCQDPNQVVKCLNDKDLFRPNVDANVYACQ